MTPEEKALYQMHFFDLGDEVEIGASGVVGTVTGLQIAEGQEDTYRVYYEDDGGNPHESWWRSSLLESADDDDNNSNVICFSCAKQARQATFH